MRNTLLWSMLLLFGYLLLAGTPRGVIAAVGDAFITYKGVVDVSIVQEQYTFYGLASYYNNVNYYLVDSRGEERLAEGAEISILADQWLAVVGRFKVLLIRAEGLRIQLKGERLVVINPKTLEQSGVVVRIVDKSQLATVAPELDQLRYVHLWDPLAQLSKLVESSLVSIQQTIVSSWGWSLVLFSLLLKLLLLPVGIMTVHFQRSVSQVQAKLAPRISEIKANHDGEEAHNRLMAAHKELEVSPFYTLKPMLGSFIQIPILIAVFNALGEMPQFARQPFLWIDDLAYPDVVGHLPFALPMFGDVVSLLPFLMTVITLYSTIIFQNRHAPAVDVRRQKRNLYLMAAAFFILFYPFPAVMVLYWTLANILQTIQQQIIRI